MLEQKVLEFISTIQSKADEKELSLIVDVENIDHDNFNDAFFNDFLPYVFNNALVNTLRGTTVTLRISKNENVVEIYFKDNSLGENQNSIYEIDKLQSYFSDDVSIKVNNYAMSDNEVDHGLELVINFNVA